MEVLNLKELIADDENRTATCHIYPSDKINCGVLPDENGIIYGSGSIQEKYKTKHIMVCINTDIPVNKVAQ